MFEQTFFILFQLAFLSPDCHAFEQVNLDGFLEIYYLGSQLQAKQNSNTPSTEVRNQQRSAQLSQLVRLLAQSISQFLDEDFAQQLPPILRHDANSPKGLSELLDQKQFRPSIGVSVDPKGEATTNASMVYLWTPNGTVYGEGIFQNGSAILAGRPLELGDFVHLEEEGEGIATDNSIWESERRFKRAPKGGGRGGGGGGGGRGGGGGGGRGGGGRTSGGRSFSSAGGRMSAGKGAIRPHVWIFASTGHSYRWLDDSEESAAENGQINDDVRMEISLCFGAHKARESCSAKVDAMLEKMAMEKQARINAQWERIKDFIFYGFLLVMLILVLICAYFGEKEAENNLRRH